MAKWYDLAVQQQGACVGVSVDGGRMIVSDTIGTISVKVDGKTILMKNMRTPHGLAIEKFKFTKKGVVVKTSRGEFPALSWDVS